MAERRAAAKVRREAKAAAELAELKARATAITEEYQARVLTPSTIEGFIREIVDSVVHRVPTVSRKNQKKPYISELHAKRREISALLDCGVHPSKIERDLGDYESS